MIIHVKDPKTCGIKVGDIFKYKDRFRPSVVVTGIRKAGKRAEQPKTPHFRCPHCNGDLDEYMDA